MRQVVGIGIDLGTSNSVAAAALRDSGIEVCPATQASGPHAVVESETLPSVMYLPAEGEFEPGSFRMPWSEEQQPLVGAFARELGAKNPERAVTSAKSWLCHPAVDRKAPILPWGAEFSAQKISPLDASAAFLRHLRSSAAFHNYNPELAGAVVLTVPASFDETARVLTREAAQAAGWGEVTLLEEPQAAVYAWLSGNQTDWRTDLTAGDLILVCDVGGGTTDFSLIAVRDLDGELGLERVSVGEHILLGGDNMDLALAYAVNAELESQGTILDHWKFLGLVQQCRAAKERMLGAADANQAVIGIAGAGSSLFASSISVTITRERMEQVVVEGFFPITGADELPVTGRSAAMHEIGLPYALEPAVSRHLCKFLHDSGKVVEGSDALRSIYGGKPGVPVHPTAILFNGGVFEADLLRGRVMSLLSAWGAGEVRELKHPGGGAAELQTAVARGAAYYAELRAENKGVRIRSGTARSYYVGVQASMPAVPGVVPPVHGICIVPLGSEEGSVHVLDREFGVQTNAETEFRFFSSTSRPEDHVGSTVRRASAELIEHPPLKVTLPAAAENALVPVKLRAELSPVGTLELRLESTQSEESWKLEFDVRGARG